MLGKNINKAIVSKIEEQGQFTQLGGLLQADFFKCLENIFNGDESSFKDFAFQIFDSNNDGQISEMDLQELMKSSTKQKYYHKGDITEIKRNETIYNLNQSEKDIFLEFFYPDYIKIIQKMKTPFGKGDDFTR